MMLTRFWFEFAGPLDEWAFVLTAGCGVTAYSEHDAIDLIRERVLGGHPVPAIKRMIKDIDIRDLDEGSIRANMIAPNLRGVWFPMGFQ